MYKEKAKEILKNVSLRPGMYINTKAEAMCIATTLLELFIPYFHMGKFYKKHNLIKGSIYIHLKDKPDDKWIKYMMEDAISMIDQL